MTGNNGDSEAPKTAAQKFKEEQYNFAVANHTELEIDKLFKALIKLKGSDLHLKVAKPPYVRVAVRSNR